MPVSRRSAAGVLVLFAVAIGGGAAEATCPYSQPVRHSFGGWFDTCSDGQAVGGYIWVLANPALNSASDSFVGFVCAESGTVTSQSIDCQPEAGRYFDGLVTIAFDWGGFGIPPGCPVPPTGGDGDGRIAIHLVDRNGWSILTSLGYSTSFAMFLVEAAQKLDATSNVALPLSCQPAEQTLLHVDGVTRDNGQVHVALTLSLPTIRSDCDAGTVGAALGGCPDGPLSIPPRGLGRLYTRVTECNAGVGDIRTSAWALAGAPDSEGHAAISFPEPTSLSECAFIGATYRLGGTETPAIGGFVKIKHGNDCPDADGDGLTACGGDCNDADPNTRPGRPEICDGMDNDCDGAADELLGMESCGLGACARTVPRCTNGAPQNCVPGSPSPEGLTCDGVDNDCNGLVDDVPHPADADGDGNPCNIDCNDHDRFSRSRSIEICNGLDDDCDGLVDDLDDTVADLDDDLRAGVCDDCPTSYDPAQGDLDSDGRGDACDNCPSADNSQQDDLDHDAEGDACDLDDGLILIRASQAFVYWQAESGFDSFNLYRGDLAVLRQTGESTQDPATVPLAARACDLPDPDVLDATALSPGQAVFWLVTGNGPGGESSLGTDSTGQPRPNTHPCP